MIRIVTKTKNELVRQDLQNLFLEIPKVGKFKVRNILQRIANRMSAQGKASKSPVQWDSERQRKAYFATDGFGAGIPYKRSGKYERSWKVTEGKNSYTLENTAKRNGKKYGGYVSGDLAGSGQSRIHGGRWKLLKDATETELAKLPQELRDAIVVTSKRAGFKSK